MLQFIRDRATGWLAWAVVLLICIPFALWGVYDYLSPNPNVAVAKVNDTELTLQQFQEAYQRQRQRLQNLLGENFEASGLDETVVREQSLESLIEDELLVQAAIGAGLRVSDEQLARAIHAQEVFQEGGQFSPQRYEQWLRMQGYSPEGFEVVLRRSMLTEQLFSGIVGSAIATDRERERLARLLGQQRSFATLEVPRGRYGDMTFSEEELEAYYDAHRDELMVPEQVAVAYLVLSRDAISQEVRPSEEELRAAYEASKLNYVSPEQRKVSHILVAVGEEADEAEVAEARAQVEALADRLAAGEDFAELAREHSDDPGSARRGGDLGFFERGVMDPRFEEAAFSLEPGEVSEPARTRFGFHLIRVDEVRAGHTKPFEEARDEVLADYRRTQAEHMYYERVERLANLTFEHPHSLEIAAEELGLEIRETELFSREQPPEEDPIASQPGFVEVAFSPELMEDGVNGEVIELPGNQAVVMRVLEHREARSQTLEEARETIAARLRLERAREAARAAGEELLEALRGGADPQAVAESLGGEWTEHEALGRRADAVDPALLSHVFAMPRAGDAPLYDGVTVPSGDYVIVALRSVIDGETENMSEEELAELEGQLASQYGRAAYDGYIRALRDQAEVVIHEQEL